MSGPVRLGGTSANRPAYGAKQYNHADLQKSPSAFLRADPLDDGIRDRAAKIFCITVLTLSFIVPLMLAGIMLCFN